ncbi:hypothetical protein V9T40_006289 [Parthenolecanium corni]|uniref:Uncharacterized protein n=1 Tax=Parthenolecanium corni TaxID=536013 RepID=A0AAN9Y5E8_9HEMI
MNCQNFTSTSKQPSLKALSANTHTRTKILAWLNEVEELQRMNDVTTKINVKLTRYIVQIGHLKTLLENRLGFRMPQFEEGLEQELIKDYVNKETQTEGANMVENGEENLVNDEPVLIEPIEIEDSEDEIIDLDDVEEVVRGLFKK